MHIKQTDKTINGHSSFLVIPCLRFAFGIQTLCFTLEHSGMGPGGGGWGRCPSTNILS